MGSLKDEMRGLREDHQPHEKTNDGEHPGGSDGGTEREGPQINTSQESTTQGDNQPKLHMNASNTEEGGKNPISKDQVLSGGDSNNTDSVRVKGCTQTDAIPEKTTTDTHNNMAISEKSLNDGDGDDEIQREEAKDRSMCQDREKEAEIESILVSVPSTSDPSNPRSPDLRSADPRSPDPRSPAPFGQHHMRTQVSLEVVQCHSAATSPMTPPEGSHSFFFPSSFGRAGTVGTDTKDAELQVGQQVEFCSVATSPMTPKTPSTTAFPELIGRETLQKVEKVKNSEEQRQSGQQESFPETKSPAEAESTGALKLNTSKDLREGVSSNASPESSVSCPGAELIESQVTLEDSNQLCKQQRMGSMDQDITILVTHYGNNEEEETAELSFHTIEPEMVKIDEYEELCDAKGEDGNEKISTEPAAPDQAQDTSNTNPPQNKTEEPSVPVGKQPKADIKPDVSEVRESKDTCEDLKDISLTKHPVPESPAPFGCHNIRTQVSLEVVQCQSAATSPMTPPEGDHAFNFPSSFGKCATVGTETKDAELQVGQQVEFRSVATAPMTPRTPTTTTFPEIRKEASIEEKIKGEEKCEEPVQEVSWDEKGMTWEVYGAVVEVAVLGSAIQKHLEKQVKKQKRQPSMPPPPPLNPSATPLASESTHGGSGSGKGRAGKRGERDGKVSRRRRNPFRLLMENMQQPHCCSRAHTTE
ncbi:G protein-regulated inducer of neurite outgrowth 1 [Toxotes jaculatrix]|uniref:G protein-regulated inducer of neurite outgrowth 1 n=1 Tax=Toxotes jaculatrix TaxID=941984 RepID=UPI001B3AC841|nr:G protein-regulated inducer of neurite outgrowth 1 [Toxotes jaculatrix]